MMSVESLDLFFIAQLEKVVDYLISQDIAGILTLIWKITDRALQRAT